MKITQGLLERSIPTISKILNEPMPIEMAYRLITLSAELGSRVDSYNDRRNQILNQYGEPSESNPNQTIIPVEKVEEFKKALDELNAEEVEINLPDIAVEDLGSIMLSINETLSINWLFK